MVPGQGFEPRYHAPEACVLPLDDPGMRAPILAKRLCSVNPHIWLGDRPTAGGRGGIGAGGLGVTARGYGWMAGRSFSAPRSLRARRACISLAGSRKLRALSARSATPPRPDASPPPGRLNHHLPTAAIDIARTPRIGELT